MDSVHPGFPYVAIDASLLSLPADNLLDYPILLTAWHLIFATVMTQIMARTTTLLDGRKSVKMTGRVYLRAIVPIGVFFSLSLICGNLTYLYLSVSFIQMLKVRLSNSHSLFVEIAKKTSTGFHPCCCSCRWLGPANRSGRS